MSTESNFSFTTKLNGDLLTVRGDSVEEFYSNAVLLASHGDIFHVLGKLQAGEVAQPPFQAPVQSVAQTAPWDQPIQQAIQNVQAQIPAQVVQQQVAGGVNVASSPAPAQPQYAAGPATPSQGGQTRTVTGKFNQQWTYDIPGAPQGQYGPMVQLVGSKKAGGTYTCWAEQAEGPEWKGGRVDYASLKNLRQYIN